MRRLLMSTLRKTTMTFIRENQLATLGFCLFLGLVSSALITANALITVKKYADEAISVTGAADKLITADNIVWSCRLTTRNNTMQSAYAQLKKETDVVKKFLLAHGLKPTELSMAAIVTETLYTKDNNGNNTNTVEGFDMTQNITIESERVDAIEILAKEANDLINQNITFVSDTPQFYYTKLNDLKVEMLGKATENAKARARSMARSTGNDIGVIRSAQMGVFQITSKNSTDVSDYGINDTSSKDKKVTAVVNVSFTVK